MLNSALEELPKYTGQTDDLETDLYYYGSRYYDPVLGRFIQPDSIIADAYSSQSLNLYSYVLNNPLEYIDPFGYAPVSHGWEDDAAIRNDTSSSTTADATVDTTTSDQAAQQGQTDSTTGTAAPSSGDNSTNSTTQTANVNKTEWPAGGRVTSAYGFRTDPITGVKSFHNGVDIANPVGDNVVASDDGEVVSTSTSPSGAHQVIVRNNDGSISGYAHVAPRVSVGDHVNAGSPIGVTDLSGRSTGGHVHYTYRPEAGIPHVDPLTHLPERN